MDFFALLNAPADTTGYYIAGYVVFFTVMTLYLTSLFIRNRKLVQEYELMIDLDQQD